MRTLEEVEEEIRKKGYNQELTEMLLDLVRKSPWILWCDGASNDNASPVVTCLHVTTHDRPDIGDEDGDSEWMRWLEHISKNLTGA